MIIFLSKSRKSRKAGLLIDFILFSSLFAGLLVIVNQYVQRGQDLQTARSMGSRFSELNAASDVYLRTQLSAIKAALPAAGNQVTISLDSTGFTSTGLKNFKDAGVLGVKFLDKSYYSQKTALLVLRTPDIVIAGSSVFDFEAVLVSHGGRVIPDDIVAQAAGFGDGRTGSILAKDTVVNSGGFPAARGAKGSWIIPLTDPIFINSGLVLTPGRLISYASFQKTTPALQSKFLSRVPTGDPVDNQMETAIDMNNNFVAGLAGLCGDGSDPKTCAGGAPVNIIGGEIVSGNSSVTGNVTVNGSESVNGALTSNTSVSAPLIGANKVNAGCDPFPSVSSAPVFSSAHIGSRDLSYDLNGCTKARIADLTVDRLNTDAFIYTALGATSPLSQTDAITLNDVLPTTVMKGSFIVSGDQLVPKPQCLNSQPGNFSRAKIFVINSDSASVSLPIVNTTATLSYTPITVLQDISISLNTLTKSNVVIPTVNQLTLDTTTTPGASFVSSYAEDAGNSWRVKLVSRYVDQDNNLQILGNSFNKAVVQTMCYYGL